MNKLFILFNAKKTLLLAVVSLLFGLLLLGSANFIMGQENSLKEICNGIDDNGDGRIDEGVNCDHYLSYLIDKLIKPINVVLRDQFMGPTEFQLTSIERLLNPARKNHGNTTFIPKREDLHYLAYRLKPSDDFNGQSVLIENQFEKRIVLATTPRYLLTPTGKKKGVLPVDKIISQLPSFVSNRILATMTPPVPKNANHYLCYDVEPYDLAVGVSLKDQFQKRKFEVIRARYLCNPVQKTHDGKISEIVDQDNHIMCYEVVPHLKMNLKAITNDQFGLKSQTLVQPEEICVPTVKTELDKPTCVQPDENGTAVIFASDKEFRTTGGQLVIIPSALATTGLTADGMLMSGPDTIITKTGTPESGETYKFETEMLSMTLSGSGRVLNIPVNGEIKTNPRTPGDPVQSFDTEMMKLQGQLPPGDPDFDLLRITAGNSFGLPSPGHTTLIRSGTKYWSWNVDSFFDITYRIDFVGAPDGPYAGQSGSNNGAVKLQGSCQSSD